MEVGATAMKNHTTVKRQLETLRDELARSLNRPAAVDLEVFADPIDSILASIDRDVRLNHLQRTANQYREVVAAIGRIDAGEYGICQDCEEAISPQRLSAVPQARRCVHCQERLERAAA
jgi:DnaK suppressor protein